MAINKSPSNKYLFLLLIPLFIIIFSYGVTANANWFNFGNNGAKYGGNRGYDFLSWSSGFPSDYNNSFTECNIPYDPDVTPKVGDMT